MKESFTKHLISLILAALLICTAGPVFAEGEETAPSLIDNKTTEAVADGQVQFLENEPVSDVKNIRFAFMDTGTKAYRWGFPYSDSFFRNSPDKFSLKMAQGSLGLAVSSFKSPSGRLETNYETYFKGAGFTNLYMYGYDKPTTEDSLSVIIGMKQIDDFIVIAAVACGQGYGKEWIGNMKVGDGIRHEGFDSAAGQFEAHLDRYIKDNKIKGKKKLWITGFSRAAAVANLVAADMTESGGFDDIYAYLFGVPRTTKEPAAYKGIYNICGQYDPVPDTPFQSWGYERYGTDLFTPAQESDPYYGEHEIAAVNTGDKIGGDGFRNNPEVNYQLHLILESIDEMFDSSREYEQRLQPLMIKAMKQKSGDDSFMDVLTSAVETFAPKNSREASEKGLILDYLSYVTGQHMRATQRQIEYGSWNPNESLAANLVIEHRPVTYAKWLFSTDDARKLFSTGIESRRVTIIGDVDAAVYRDGKGITAIDRKGKISVPEGEKETPFEEITGVFAMRNGHQTVISLPADTDYQLIITAPQDCNVLIYDILISAKKLKPEPGRLYLGNIDAGQYRFSIKAGESPDTPVEIGEGQNRSPLIGSKFNYSPTSVMGDELAATMDSYLNLSTALIIVVIIMAGAFLLLIICMMIYGVHRRKVKRGHSPYSDLYVIIPHLIVITVSAIMTQFVTFYLYSVGSARAICAAITIFYIFLLALRGAIRSRKPMHYLIAGLILLCAGATAVYYNRLPIASFSTINIIAFFVMVLLLCALAIRMFRREGKNKSRKSPVMMLLCVTAAMAFCLTAVPSYAESSDIVYHESEEAAVEELRSHMKQREETVTIGLKGKIDQEGLQAIIGRLVKEAVAHTGKPDEGDYIGFQYESYTGYARTTHAGISPAMEIEYKLSYYDDAEQEAEVDKKVKEIIEGLELDDKTDFEKIAAIHDYICGNVEYVSAGAEGDIVRTAYGALIDGKAVCQGYSVSLYRLLLEAGIDNRIIYGQGLSDTGESGNHTWNIIKLNDEYYYMDATWDDVASFYKYFLVPANDGFEDRHVADESFSDEFFSEEYPLAEEAYKDEAMGLLGQILKLKKGLMNRMREVFSYES